MLFLISTGSTQRTEGSDITASFSPKVLAMCCKHKPWNNFMVECSTHACTHTLILEIPRQHRRVFTYSAWTKRLKAWKDLKFFLHFKRAFQLDTTLARSLAVCQSVAADSAALECNVFLMPLILVFCVRCSQPFESWSSLSNLKESTTKRPFLSENMQM